MPAMGRFLQCCNANVLTLPCSVVHHKRHLPYGGVYLHHFALLRAMPGRFRVDWLSEAFRWAAAASDTLLLLLRVAEQGLPSIGQPAGLAKPMCAAPAQRLNPDANPAPITPQVNTQHPSVSHPPCTGFPTGRGPHPWHWMCNLRPA